MINIHKYICRVNKNNETRKQEKHNIQAYIKQFKNRNNTIEQPKMEEIAETENEYNNTQSQQQRIQQQEPLRLQQQHHRNTYKNDNDNNNNNYTTPQTVIFVMTKPAQPATPTGKDVRAWLRQCSQALVRPPDRRKHRLTDDY